jgi:hypothetical protein
MISLNVKAWLENIVLGLLMGAKGCADLSAFRAPAVNIGHFLGISCGCRRVQPRRLQKAALWPRSFSAAAYWPAAYPPYGCGCSSGVEHNLAKVGVEGSNPFARSKTTDITGSSLPKRPKPLSADLRGSMGEATGGKLCRLWFLKRAAIPVWQTYSRCCSSQTKPYPPPPARRRLDARASDCCLNSRLLQMRYTMGNSLVV